jgi:uncharacterized membrane protein YgdD (TMEM256/DUF423 family)
MDQIDRMDCMDDDDYHEVTKQYLICVALTILGICLIIFHMQEVFNPMILVMLMGLVVFIGLMMTCIISSNYDLRLAQQDYLMLHRQEMYD